MEPLLTALQQELTRVYPPVVAQLNAGASDQAIQETEQQLGFPLPEEVKNLYRWKDGINIGQEIPFKAHFMSSFGYFASLAEAAETYQYSVKENKELREKMFQLFSDGQGNLVLIDCDEPSKDYGKILLFDPFAVDEKHTGLTVLYDSLPAFLETMIACYREGIYSFKALATEEENQPEEEAPYRAGFVSDEDYNKYLDYDEDTEVILRTDPEREHTISKKLNPQAAYWKKKR
ncbi:SMI1/KNR4 family protein [Chitinophaga agrisoli]|uniref:SMI1/KNR4 family protein n=1 Tax=Chitinophaga agrisoli TaxID=2607653 RepID=A0A5B2VW45_9BACT|nr:SMI1/KNR4 family protein [Chitinophaga agrisoli]KAA2242532.1 SMI1/KNR4 family protein [Chitinophaga agrisoli]